MKVKRPNLLEKIRTKRERLIQMAGDGKLSLASGIVLQSSQELDELIVDYLKQTKQQQSNNKVDDEMLKIDQKFHNSEQNAMTIVLDGCLDISTIDHLKEVVLDLNSYQKLTIDFSSLSFIDSTGIGTLLDIIYDAKQTNQKVKFLGLNEYIKEVFETVGIIRVLEAIQKDSLNV
jgi:anti-anti-sigma factor